MAAGGIGILPAIHIRWQWCCFTWYEDDVCSNNLSMGAGQRCATGCVRECAYFMETRPVGESLFLLVGDAVQELDTGEETDAEIMEGDLWVALSGAGWH